MSQLEDSMVQGFPTKCQLSIVPQLKGRATVEVTTTSPGCGRLQRPSYRRELCGFGSERLL